MKKTISILFIAAIAATTVVAFSACGSASMKEATTAPTTVAVTTVAPATAASDKPSEQGEQISADNNAQSQDNYSNDNVSEQSYVSSDTYIDSDSDSDGNVVESSQWRSEEGNAMSKDVATQTLMDYSKEEYPGSTAVSKGCMSFYNTEKKMYGYRVNLEITTAEGNVVLHGFHIYDDGSITVEY